MPYLMGDHGPCFKSPKPLRDKGHSSFIHELTCCLTGARGSFDDRIVQHHLLRCPSRQGGRSGDNHSVPMLDSLHKRLHDNEGNERAFMARYGITNPVALAEFLHKNTGKQFICEGYMRKARDGQHHKKSA